MKTNERLAQWGTGFHFQRDASWFTLPNTCWWIIEPKPKKVGFELSSKAPTEIHAPLGPIFSECVGLWLRTDNFWQKVWNQPLKWPNNKCFWRKANPNWHWELALACSHGLHWRIWWLWNIESWLYGFNSYQKLDFNLSKMLYVYGLRFTTSWLRSQQKSNCHWETKSWFRRFIFFTRDWSWTITSVYSSSG